MMMKKYSTENSLVLLLVLFTFNVRSMEDAPLTRDSTSIQVFQVDLSYIVLKTILLKIIITISQLTPHSLNHPSHLLFHTICFVTISLIFWINLLQRTLLFLNNHWMTLYFPQQIKLQGNK
jgi:hypothetical protein